jgi:hypothetical protein
MSKRKLRPSPVTTTMLPTVRTIAGFSLSSITAGLLLVLEKYDSPLTNPVDAEGNKRTPTSQDNLLFLYLVTHDPAEILEADSRGTLLAAVNLWAFTLPLSALAEARQVLPILIEEALATLLPMKASSTGDPGDPLAPAPAAAAN